MAADKAEDGGVGCGEGRGQAVFLVGPCLFLRVCGITSIGLSYFSRAPRLSEFSCLIPARYISFREV